MGFGGTCEIWAGEESCVWFVALRGLGESLRLLGMEMGKERDVVMAKEGAGRKKDAEEGGGGRKGGRRMRKKVTEYWGKRDVSRWFCA